MLLDEVEKELKETKNLKEKVSSELASLPAGQLRISVSGHKQVRYYIKKKSYASEIYVQSDSNEIKQIAQYQYLSKINLLLEHKLKLLKALFNFLKKQNLSDIFEKMNSVRKTLITPLFVSDATYAIQWSSVKWNRREIQGNSSVFTTQKNEKVRSKSELIIANLLTYNKVPYRYEYPFLTKRGITIYPDFTVLNKRTRKVYFLEHFGMMDNPSYVKNFIIKMKTYSESDIQLGKKLLVTFESDENPLDTRDVQRLINDYLK